MILVDSSIWIAAERRFISLIDVIPVGETVAACPAIAHEVLRGAQNPKQYRLGHEALVRTDMLDSPTPFKRLQKAAEFYHRGRQGGLTPSITDCLIAACAIANHVPLLHQDSDFDHIALAVPALRMFPRSTP